jgi:hypothetical protein
MEFYSPNNSLLGALQSEEITSGFNIEETILNINNISPILQQKLIVEVEGFSSSLTNNSSHGVQSTGLMAVRELLDC